MKRSRISLLLVLIFVCSLFSAAAFAAGLTNDSVLSQHVKEADGTSGQNTNSGSGIKTGHLQDSAVTTNKVADGAVTNTKISDGAVTTGKIVDGAVIGAKIADRTITSTKIGFYRNVIVVAPTGGNYTSPVDALSAITDASASNPYLVKVMPGVYNVDSSSVQMKEYVDIEGSILSLPFVEVGRTLLPIS